MTIYLRFNHTFSIVKYRVVLRQTISRLRAKTRKEVKSEVKFKVSIKKVNPEMNFKYRGEKLFFEV